VEADVVSPGLASHRHSELVAVGWKMAKPIERGGRSVRDDSLIRSSLPCRHVGFELKPCHSEVEVVGYGSAN
jgi:hypothetical protein